jgi:plastocyanin
MPNGVRNSIWAVFFLAGMAFMAALIFMLRPDLFSNPTVRERPGSLVIVGAAERDAAKNEDEPKAAPLVREPAKKIATPLSAEKEEVKVEPVRPVAEKQPEAVPHPVAEQPPLSLPAAPAIAAQVENVRRLRPVRAVFGHVTLLGDLPPAKELLVKDGFCGPHTPATTFVSRVFIRAKDNSLADVLVSLEARSLDKRYWHALPPVVIKQRNCEFEPYVTAIQLGQKVTFENLDPVLHNIHTLPSIYDRDKNDRWRELNRSINVAQMPKGKPVVAEFTSPENFIRVECNVHPWMVAYVCVMPNPFFAVTKQDGRFEIPNVPEGEYTVVATHRRGGSISKKVRVTADEAPEVELVLEAPKDVAQN